MDIPKNETRTDPLDVNRYDNRVQSQPLNLKINHSNSTTTSDMNNNTDNNSSFSASTDNNQWLVEKATEWHSDLDENYKMSSKNRGICLIINNIEFEMDILAKRKGSDMDAYRFKKIFHQLGFQVESKRNLTSDKMKKLFKQISARCLSKHDSLIVILLSHGTESGIYGTDGLEVDLNDILREFDNKRCRALIGKPKVFIIQACRGQIVDYGVKNSSQMDFFSQPETQGFTQPSQLCSFLKSNSTPQITDTPKISRWTEVDKNNHPTRTDMLLCFSCHTGYVSTRNENEGSWLGASLAKQLQFQAHGKHLLELLNMVSREIRRKKSSDGHKQVLEITSIGFDRNLYFNPGLSDEK